MSTQDICDLIKAVGREPVERDTLYNEIFRNNQLATAEY
jgi:2-iminoacetate synthase ThiH